MNTINDYKRINYFDNEPHTATVAEHIANIMQDLKGYMEANTNLYEIMASSDYLEEAGATINALSDRNLKDIVTISYMDWSGYIIKDEEN